MSIHHLEEKRLSELVTEFRVQKRATGRESAELEEFTAMQLLSLESLLLSFALLFLVSLYLQVMRYLLAFLLASLPENTNGIPMEYIMICR
jgi:hypothetical protein